MLFFYKTSVWIRSNSVGRHFWKLDYCLVVLAGLFCCWLNAIFKLFDVEGFFIFDVFRLVTNSRAYAFDELEENSKTINGKKSHRNAYYKVIINLYNTLCRNTYNPAKAANFKSDFWNKKVRMVFGFLTNISKFATIIRSASKAAPYQKYFDVSY